MKGEQGLVVQKPAQKVAYFAPFEQSVSISDLGEDESFVVQYDLRLVDGLSCGGAYIKLPSFQKDFKPETFKVDTPYTVMFGPDHCGTTNKVHFIIKHKNPVTGKYVEHGMKDPPRVKLDGDTHLYSLVVRGNNKFEIYIDQESEKSGSLLEDMEPPINPPKMIPDPSQSKPADWVDEAKIADPEAKKPEDWDEDAPMMIDDTSVEKPEDWKDDAPKTIPDPKSKKPDDWDDSDDGDWEAPTIDNPACKDSSCRNDRYYGRWDRYLDYGKGNRIR